MREALKRPIKHTLEGCRVATLRWFMLADKSGLLYDIGLYDGSIFGDAVKLIVSRMGTMNWHVNVTWGRVHQNMTMGQAPSVTQVLHTILLFVYLLFSHHDAGTGVETLLPVTEPSQPAPRRTVYLLHYPKYAASGCFSLSLMSSLPLVSFWPIVFVSSLLLCVCGDGFSFARPQV